MSSMYGSWLPSRIDFPVVRVARHRHLRAAAQHRSRNPGEQQRAIQVVPVVVGVVRRARRLLVEQTDPVLNAFFRRDQRVDAIGVVGLVELHQPVLGEPGDVAPGPGRQVVEERAVGMREGELDRVVVDLVGL